MIAVSSINNTNYTKPNFKALKVAETTNMLKNFAVDIDIYKLRSEDKPFIEKLSRKIDLTELYPKLKPEQCMRWQQTLNYCFNHAFDFKNITYISIYDNKPCGIATYNKDKLLFLDGICSIPVDVNQKVPGVGKTLFYQVFKDAIESKCDEIFLDAVTDGPFDAVKMYEHLGFKHDNPLIYTGYDSMYCNKYTIPKELKKLSEYIKYEPVNEERTNLNKFLD